MFISSSVIYFLLGLFLAIIAGGILYAIKEYITPRFRITSELVYATNGKVGHFFVIQHRQPFGAWQTMFKHSDESEIVAKYQKIKLAHTDPDAFADKYRDRRKEFRIVK